MIPPDLWRELTRILGDEAGPWLLERAAIAEYHGGLTREAAEKVAIECGWDLVALAAPPAPK